MGWFRVLVVCSSVALLAGCVEIPEPLTEAQWEEVVQDKKNLQDGSVIDINSGEVYFSPESE